MHIAFFISSHGFISIQIKRECDVPGKKKKKKKYIYIYIYIYIILHYIINYIYIYIVSEELKKNKIR